MFKCHIVGIYIDFDLIYLYIYFLFKFDHIYIYINNSYDVHGDKSYHFSCSKIV